MHVYVRLLNHKRKRIVKIIFISWGLFDCLCRKMMKRRTLAGSCGVGIFVIALVTTVIAFTTPSWIVSDYRITGAKLNKLGLWVHCFRSLPDIQDDNNRRFFVGCRWVYDPFTTGYHEIRGFLLPAFMIATQFFYTLSLIGVLMSLILVLLFALCAGPDQKNFILLIKIISYLLLGSGVCGLIAVIVFSAFGNVSDWMPGHENNWFGYSFGLAVVGSIMSLIASSLFLVEANVQSIKRKQFSESQSGFGLEPKA